MINITRILAGVTTLSPERKAELATKYQAGTLMEQDKAELEEHILRAMARVSAEVEAGEEMLSRLAS